MSSQTLDVMTWFFSFCGTEQEDRMNKWPLHENSGEVACELSVLGRKKNDANLTRRRTLTMGFGVMLLLLAENEISFKYLCVEMEEIT